jgi:hypothetical protein
MTRPDTWTARLRRRLKVFFFLLAPLAIVPILAGWVGDITKGWIDDTAPFPSNLWLLIGGLAGVLISAAWLVWQGRRLLPTRVLEQSPSFEQRRVVIALLSPCDNLRQEADGHWEVSDRAGHWVSLAGKGLEDLVCETPALPQWSWQQTLRAAHYHRARLERLVLVGSTGPKGSGTKGQLDLARAFLGTWFPGTVTVYGQPSTPDEGYNTRWQADFEDLDGLGRLLRNVLRELHRDSAGFSDADIVIDCTGGFKVASIAAALVTLDRADLMFQYVGTGDHAGQIIGFNVATEHQGG